MEPWKPTLKDLLAWEEEDAALAEMDRQMLMEQREGKPHYDEVDGCLIAPKKCMEE